MVQNGGVLSGKGEIVAEVCLARRRYWNALKSFKVKDKERERGKKDLMREREREIWRCKKKGQDDGGDKGKALTLCS